MSWNGLCVLYICWLRLGRTVESERFFYLSVPDVFRTLLIMSVSWSVRSAQKYSNWPLAEKRWTPWDILPSLVGSSTWLGLHDGQFDYSRAKIATEWIHHMDQFLKCLEYVDSQDGWWTLCGKQCFPMKKTYTETSRRKRDTGYGGWSLLCLPGSRLKWVVHKPLNHGTLGGAFHMVASWEETSINPPTNHKGNRWAAKDLACGCQVNYLGKKSLLALPCSDWSLLPTKMYLLLE